MHRVGGVTEYPLNANSIFRHGFSGEAKRVPRPARAQQPIGLQSRLSLGRSLVRIFGGPPLPEHITRRPMPAAAENRFPNLIAPPGYALARFRESPETLDFQFDKIIEGGSHSSPGQAFRVPGGLCSKPRGTTIMQAAHHKETDHEKAQYAWDYRWRRITDCGAFLGSMVAKECVAFP